jgi:hypothetical protein
MGGAQVARRYANPAKSVALVTEGVVGEAQARLGRARERLRKWESAAPARSGGGMARMTRRRRLCWRVSGGWRRCAVTVGGLAGFWPYGDPKTRQLLRTAE